MAIQGLKTVSMNYMITQWLNTFNGCLEISSWSNLRCMQPRKHRLNSGETTNGVDLVKQSGATEPRAIGPIHRADQRTDANTPSADQAGAPWHLLGVSGFTAWPCPADSGNGWRWHNGKSTSPPSISAMAAMHQGNISRKMHSIESHQMHQVIP